ncbi:hypothetical protein PISMIDRAFT_675032 [Pisolithus microcarpus 441]|uniref:Uncharacterized protein n=1 Tax=Pisolithus microcarpus 441 TaxID=765257 RepID=A0A0D0A556_9AGAM|nr:hypothetical protein PISMIDRAFT_675032 [Pisolithus microcarpus 441]
MSLARLVVTKSPNVWSARSRDLPHHVPRLPLRHPRITAVAETGVNGQSRTAMTLLNGGQRRKLKRIGG